MSASYNFSAQKIIAANIAGIERGLMIAMQLVQDEMSDLLNQVGTGTPYRGGQKGTGTFRRRSVAGQPPSPETGNLLRSVQTSRPKFFSGQKFRMISMSGLVAGQYFDPAIPRYLESGTSRMRARPFIKPTLTKIKPLVKGLISDNMIRAVQKMQMGAMRKA